MLSLAALDDTGLKKAPFDSTIVRLEGPDWNELPMVELNQTRGASRWANLGSSS